LFHPSITGAILYRMADGESISGPCLARLLADVFMFAVVLVFVFLIGAAIGSFLNVCVARLPYERSILWPGSHCFSCFQPVRWYDNVPLLSYLLLRGRCRTCGARFSIRYFLVELFTGLAFLGLFYLDVVRNVSDMPFLNQPQVKAAIARGLPPWQAWMVFTHHAILLSFLIITSLCDFADMEIPLSVTLTGTVVGLILSMLFPWPFPDAQAAVGQALGRFSVNLPPLQAGLYPWPVWHPLPAWLPEGSWQLGLTTGLAGALAGMAVLRAVRFLFSLGRGIEGLGVGDADLMMMAGSFVGWQPVVMSFFIATFPALILGVLQLVRKGDQALPFGPPLALGVLLTLFLWPSIGGYIQPIAFSGMFLGLLAGMGAACLLFMAFVLRVFRGTPAS
jgi:leader peptidase (prepilin peptidase)/N-methyltransferase